MKKKIIPLLALGLTLSGAGGLTSCGGGGDSSVDPSKAVDIAMISDIGTINDSGFNQYTWEGAKKAAETLGKKSDYYVPTEDTDAERKAGIDAMLKRGAKAVVLTGYKFNELVAEYAKNNPGVAWFLIDGSQTTAENLKNVYSVEFKEQEAGYLAGYAVVKDKKYTKLAFLGGMAVPAVERFGFGYLSGICDAANDLAAAGQLTSDIEVNYGYTGNFSPSDDNLNNAKAWYTAGTEVIFTCGGAICDSVVAASKAFDTGTKKMIGVDVNQHGQQANDLYITSAEKKVEKTTKEALETYFNSFKDTDPTGEWPSDKAGKHTILDATTESVGLPTGNDSNGNPSWTFTNFTVADYNTLYAKVKANSNYTKVISDNDSTIKYSEAINNTHVKIHLKSVGSPVTNKPTVTVAANLD